MQFIVERDGAKSSLLIRSRSGGMLGLVAGNQIFSVAPDAKLHALSGDFSYQSARGRFGGTELGLHPAPGPIDWDPSTLR